MKKLLLIIPLFFVAHLSYALDADSLKGVYHFKGNVSLTNNGFSFIPTFSLGKPATVANLSIGGDRFSFDPQFRFDLAGLKPWSFIFIWRYKVVETNKFQLKAGMHLPAYSFREQSFEVEGGAETRLIPYRVMAAELLPTYAISGHVSIGAYYIHGFALEEFDPTKHIDFLSFRAYVSELRLSKQLYLNWNPEVYYLNMFGVDGFYAAHTLSVGHQKWPLSLSTTMNVKINSDVDSKDFDWNISLVYSFSHEFTKK